MKSTFVLALVIALAASCLAQKVEEEQNIRRLDKEWSQAAQHKDLEKTVSYYADDAALMPFNSPIAIGKQQIRQTWEHLMSMPGFSLTFAPTRIDVAKAGDMAYEIGTFELKMNDPQGTPTTTPGKYVVTWKKSSQGQWKVQADIFNTNQ